jgi:RNA polymerase sigma factor (sigma-70 family)
MMYKYDTAFGDTNIEVDEQYYNLLSALDEDENNNNRRHSRRHPISLENAEYEGEWFQDNADSIGDAEAAIDMEQALASLTELQRGCFTEVKISGRGYREVAADLGKSRSVVEKAVKGAIEKLKKFF